MSYWTSVFIMPGGRENKTLLTLLITTSHVECLTILISQGGFRRQYTRVSASSNAIIFEGGLGLQVHQSSGGFLPAPLVHYCLSNNYICQRLQILTYRFLLNN